MISGGRGNAQQGLVRVRRDKGIPAARGATRTLALCLLLSCALLSAPAVAAPGDTLGVYAGSGDPAGVAAFESRLGRTVARGHDYLDKRSWAAMLDISWLTARWADSGFIDRMVLTVPMIPDDGGTLAAGAAGDYNTHFRTLAERLVASGHPTVVLRLGPEFNGSWFRWTIDGPNGGPLFAAYWRQIVTTMRSVPGADFTFDWCANAGSSWLADGRQLQAADAWPGDDVVDYVGMDVYDQSWAADRGDPAARWNDHVNQKDGLAWHAQFAAAHGKPLSFPEWGLAERTDGMGGGDAPLFVEQMYRWIALQPVAYHLYFEYRDLNAEYGVFSGRFPNAATRFVELFGPHPPAQLPAPLPPPPGPPPPPAIVPGVLRWPPPAGTGSAAATGQQRGSPLARGSGASGKGLPARSHGRSDPAKLSIARAQIMRREAQLDILAPISRLASGEATVTLQAGGRRARFTATVDSARGRVLTRQRLTRAQARTGTGIVTITYAGDADTQPQEVRLRAASRKANLALTRPRLQDGRLRTSGTIDTRARGRVRTQITYTVDGVTFTREYGAPIRHGRWTLDVALAEAVLEDIAGREGALQSSTLFTGYLPARMRGEMRSHRILG